MFWVLLIMNSVIPGRIRRNMDDLTVIGGGLAGSEAAWQAAQRGLNVALYEMRPQVETGAHTGEWLAELVCSNSLGSRLADRAPGLLKNEVKRMGSLLLQCAEQTALPAGGALAVDRTAFAMLVTEKIQTHPRIRVIREEVETLPDGPVIVASGPLTSESLSKAIAGLTGQEQLYFFDAIAPIVAIESIDLSIAFRASRFGRGDQEEGDYINCPMSRDEYDLFIRELVAAERIELRKFEAGLEDGVRAGPDQYFEGCLPVEVMAKRGAQSLAFGPMRPIGLRDPRSGQRPYAVVQLRQDNQAGSLYNLVGFQTNLKFDEQKRIFRMIPGLGRAEFVRYGQMHRNTFIFSPGLLDATLEFRSRPGLFFAGQITGVEGYVGNIATGLLAGWNAARFVRGQEPIRLPGTTMLGALCHYITHAEAKDFQPMKANFGIMPALEENVRGKRAARSCPGRASRARSGSISNRGGSELRRLGLFLAVFLLALLGYLLLSGGLSRSDGEQEGIGQSLGAHIQEFNGERAFADVKYQVELGPRVPGSRAHAETVDWIASNLEKSGWEVDIQEINTAQPIRNVIAKMGDGQPRILIGAHYDSRQIADRDADSQDRALPVPGANDGASGVSVLLELGRVLPGLMQSDQGKPEIGGEIWLVFFDAEDQGNIPGWEWAMGAQAFVDQMTIRPDAVVIVDMIGDADLNVFKEKNSTPELVEELWQQALLLGYESSFIPVYRHAILDDHVPFIKAGIPAVDLIDFDYALLAYFRRYDG